LRTSSAASNAVERSIEAEQTAFAAVLVWAAVDSQILYQAPGLK
jgi:hypothetical protein